MRVRSMAPKARRVASICWGAFIVRDGNVYTSGGITTGIDFALALVEEDLGPEVMLGVSRAIIVFPKRPGGQGSDVAIALLALFGVTLLFPEIAERAMRPVVAMGSQL